MRVRRNDAGIAIPLVVTVVCLIGVLVLGANDWLTKQGVTAQQFCEESTGIVKQAVNTYSNGAFVVVGLLVAYHTWRKQRLVYYGAIYSCCLILVGFGSASMHASTTLWGGIFDMSAIYLIASFMISYSLVRLFTLSLECHIAIYMSIILCSIVLYATNAIDCNWLFAGGLGVFLLIELLVYFFKRNLNYHWLWGSIILFGMAFAIWLPSRTGEALCDPGSILQGHALWHILAALSAGVLYLFYQSGPRWLDIDISQ